MWSKPAGSNSEMCAWWGRRASMGQASSTPRGVAGGEAYGSSTNKIPPYWEPGLENRGYPFRVWMQDIDIWSAGTELQQEQLAPAVVQKLGGAARAIAREVPAMELRDGRYIATTGAQETGLTLLMRGFARRFGAFAVETSTRCIIDLLTFRRRGHENVDEALSRFETARLHVRTQAVGFDLPIPVTAWLLLEAMGVPRQTWPLALAPWQNRMPEDEDGLRQLSDSIRHQGHIAEVPHSRDSFVRGGSGRSFLEGSFLEAGTPHGLAGDEWD